MMKGVGLGCHNTFIKVLGEAGIFVFLMFVVAAVRFAGDLWKIVGRDLRACMMACGVVLLGAALATHNFLDDRNHNAMFGVLIGLTAYDRMVRRRRQSMIAQRGSRAGVWGEVRIARAG